VALPGVGVAVRIRQVRPEFWTDETMAAMSPAVRLFYIGLWNVADDAGWMDWKPSRIGAVLFPYESAKRRERDIQAWADKLVERGRLRRHDCGCADIPTLSRHQRVTGKQSFAAKELHDKHHLRSGKQSSLSGSPVTLGNGTERNVLTSEDLFSLRDAADAEAIANLEHHRSLKGKAS
jgi:hypothetical protein